MRVRELVLVFTVIAVTLAIETPAKADVIWTFENADAGATNVQGSITIANVSSAAPGTKWDLSDITDFAFFYEGLEVASSANAGQTTFFGTNSGISILEFTASEPFLPFVSIPSFGDFRSLFVNISNPDRIFTIEGSTTGDTFMFCFSNSIPSQNVCNGTDRDLVALSWTAHAEAVPEAPTIGLLGIALSSALFTTRPKKTKR